MRVTEKAIAVVISGRTVWFPRSHVLRTEVTRPGQEGLIVVSADIARAKGLAR